MVDTDILGKYKLNDLVCEPACLQTYGAIINQFANIFIYFVVMDAVVYMCLQEKRTHDVCLLKTLLLLRPKKSEFQIKFFFLAKHLIVTTI